MEELDLMFQDFEEANLSDSMSSTHSEIQTEQEGIKTNTKITFENVDKYSNETTYIVKTFEETDPEVINLIKELPEETREKYLKYLLETKQQGGQISWANYIKKIRNDPKNIQELDAYLEDELTGWEKFKKNNPRTYVLKVILNVSINLAFLALFTSPITIPFLTGLTGLTVGTIAIIKKLVENAKANKEHNTLDLSDSKHTFTNIKDKIRTGTLLNEKFS